jgi:putative restriction endonuclease
MFEGVRVPLVGPQGIFKPAAIPTGIPLTITTAPLVAGRPRPYDDEISEGLVRYRYRGNDPNRVENVGLRRAMQNATPLVYLYGLAPGRYLAAWPVFVLEDDPAQLSFTVAVDDAQVLGLSTPRGPIRCSDLAPPHA